MDIMGEISENNFFIDELKKEIKKLDLDKKDIDDEIDEFKVEIKRLEDSKSDLDGSIKEQEAIVANSKKAYGDKVVENDSIVVQDFSKDISKQDSVIKAQKLALGLSQEDLSKVNLDIDKVNKFLSGVDVKLGGSITCPSCTHVFILDGDREVLLDKKSKGDDLLIKFEGSKKSIELDVEKRKRFLESFLHTIPEAIITLEPSNRIVDWNPGAEKLFGYIKEYTSWTMVFLKCELSIVVFLLFIFLINLL